MRPRELVDRLLIGAACILAVLLLSLGGGQ